MNDDLKEIETNGSPVQRPSLAPAEGERRAISGYYPQYRYSASLILCGLREDRLEWVRLADPKAERVDDFQLGSQGRVDAYQVKWSQFGGLFTFNDLTAGRDEDSKLIAQLAQGWSALRKQHPRRRVVVHLITNQTPSNSTGARLPTGSRTPRPAHFAAFVSQAWEPAHRTPMDAPLTVPTEWQDTWTALREASGLAEEDYESFVRNCDLDFGCQYSLGSESATTLDQKIVANDIERITNQLFEVVANPEQVVELSREQLLRRLNWTDRFELRSQHQFPVDESLYQPIEATAQELAAAIDDLPGGYIAVIGSPGSGKSTLLSRLYGR